MVTPSFQPPTTGKTIVKRAKRGPYKPRRAKKSGPVIPPANVPAIVDERGNLRAAQPMEAILFGLNGPGGFGSYTPPA